MSNGTVQHRYECRNLRWDARFLVRTQNLRTAYAVTFFLLRNKAQVHTVTTKPMQKQNFFQSNRWLSEEKKNHNNQPHVMLRYSTKTCTLHRFSCSK